MSLLGTYEISLGQSRPEARGELVQDRQGYLAHKKSPPPEDPTVDLCLSPKGPVRRAFSMSEVQGYHAHKNPPPSWDPTAGLCLGPYGGPGGGGLFLMSEVPL